MSYSNKKLNEIDGKEFLLKVFKIILTIAMIYGLIYFYFNVVKPEERRFIKGSRYAYSVIQEELTKYYKENAKIYNSKEDTLDDFCEILRVKHSPRQGTCNTNKAGGHELNIALKKYNYTMLFW